jgi:hypothetical protein
MSERHTRGAGRTTGTIRPERTTGDIDPGTTTSRARAASPHRRVVNNLPDPAEVTWEPGGAQAGDGERAAEVASAMRSSFTLAASWHGLTPEQARALVQAREDADRRRLPYARGARP